MALRAVEHEAQALPRRRERAALDDLAIGLAVEEVPYFGDNLVHDPDLIGGFLALHRGLESGRDGFRNQERLVATFGNLFRRHGSGGRRIDAPPRDRILLERVTERMQGDYASELKLASLAEGVGLSIFQLIGLFRRTVGLTPHVYLTQIRLAAACRQLRQGQSPAEVAATVGFYDQSALNRHFKRCYGITPMQFARAATA